MASVSGIENGLDRPYNSLSENISSDDGLRTGDKIKKWVLSLFTLKFLKILIGGQVLSLLICGTAVTSQLLNPTGEGVNAPTTQSFLNYLLLAIVYCGWLVCRSQEKNFYHVFMNRWWKYLIVALIDVEANYMVVKAYHYTTLVSVQLLDSITIPVVLLLSFLLLRVRYRLNHLIGVVICLVGVPLMIWADFDAGRSHSEDAKNKVLGDILCLVGASFYGVSNVAEEYAVRHYSRVEFLGMLGLFGTFISGIQLVIFERDELTSITWDGRTIGLLVAFALCLFCLYSLFPVVIQWSSAAVVNLSILTADFYSLLFGLFLFNFVFSGIYFFSFAIIIIGVLIYGLRATKEAPRESRYNFFRNESEHPSDAGVDEISPLPTDERELTEEEREQMHKDFNRHLNGTN
ncbi:solute carrier family 35 member F2-like [Amphiura filiformis]|uniref:solute carrier family 35 member F2-like n=1 Tax=Amphiura filiformis TaxID=82378 RepID=UPI003B214D83